jgi:hypothetical protein
MVGIVGTEWDFEVGIVKKIGQFTYHGVVISKFDPCFGGGKWNVICGW